MAQQGEAQHVGPVPMMRGGFSWYKGPVPSIGGDSPHNVRGGFSSWYKGPVPSIGGDCPHNVGLVPVEVQGLLSPPRQLAFPI